MNNEEKEHLARAAVVGIRFRLGTVLAIQRAEQGFGRPGGPSGPIPDDVEKTRAIFDDLVRRAFLRRVEEKRVPGEERYEFTSSGERDLLLEYLHAVQDKYGCLGVQHLVALAEIMKIPQAEVYEVASFYAYFDIVSETESAPPEITVRICDSLTCAMFGAQKLLKQAEGKLNSTVRVQRAPCMGRCDQAPVAAVGSSHVSRATMDLLELHVSGSKGLPEVTGGHSQGLSKYDMTSGLP